MYEMKVVAKTPMKFTQDVNVETFLWRGKFARIFVHHCAHNLNSTCAKLIVHATLRVVLLGR